MGLIVIMVNEFNLIIYKYRYLFLYIIFGALSLSIESALRSFLSLFLDDFIANLISLFFGVCIAYYLNSKFNFKVPKDRIKISIFYFFCVSIFSFSIQYTVGSATNLNFFQNRFLLAGTLFIVAYFLHRRLTFKEFQKLGIAIHLNNNDEVDSIFQQIGNYPDFIHIDLIDETYNENNIAINLDKLDKIVNIWKSKKIQLHIMSKNPSYWINELAHYNLEIFFHSNCNEGYQQLQSSFEDKNLGIVLDKNIEDKELELILRKFSNIMVLSIDKPGESGQKFNKEFESFINKLIKKSLVRKNKLTLDGGMTPTVASNFDVQEIVSASSVLGSANSKFQIINFQTSQKYVFEDEK